MAWLNRRLPYVAVVATPLGLALAGATPSAPLLAAFVTLAVAAARTALRVAVVAALALLLGGLAGAARLDAIDAPSAALRDGQRLEGRAHLLEPPRPSAYGASVEVRVISGRAAGARLLALLPRGMRLPPRAGPGLELMLSGEFRAVAHDTGAGFDFGAHLRRHGMAGELRVEQGRLTGRRRAGIAGVLDATRRHAAAGIGAGLSATTAALGHGMVLGADDGIPTGVRDDFRDSGLAHLLAASGSNVMLLSALALPLLAAAGLPYAARIPALLALIAVYIPLAGGGPAIQRAGVMGAATLLAVALARPASRWYALGLAACATLALNPRACGDPGWQLSFVAVAGILLLAPGIRRGLAALPRVAAEGIAITVAATIATAPLVAYHFGAVPAAGLAANVVALPLIAPIMWLGMLRAVLGQALDVNGVVGAVATAVNGLLGMALEPFLHGLEGLAALFADAPGGQLELALSSPLAVVAAYALIVGGVVGAARMARRLDTRASIAVAYVRRLPRLRRIGLLLLAVVLIGLALARGLAPPPIPARLTVTFLDVGQGDATLIQHPDGSTVLFDGGPPEAGVARLLRRAGVRRLSAVVMTHASRDHHGGLAEVVERFPIGLLIDGGDGSHDPSFRSVVAAARDRGIRSVKALAPLTLWAGALRIDVLSPLPRLAGPPPEDPNPRAVVAVVGCDGFDLLLSGDAESDVLLPLALPDVDAMKVPHHGSADPGLPGVLERVRPEVASIPVGENSYGHPAPTTIEALREAGVSTWRNDRNGSVRVTVEAGRVEVEPERGVAVESGP